MADIWANSMACHAEPRITLHVMLPLGEFTVTIAEPHATLQGVRIPLPSAILKIVFRHIFFLFLMQFRLWRAAAFVSSPRHLFDKTESYELFLSCMK